MEAVKGMVVVVSVPRACSVPLGHPTAWDLCQRQTRQTLFDTIFVRRASFPLVDVNGFVMTAIRSVSVTSLGIFGGARLVRFPNRDMVPADVVEGGVGELFVGVEEVGRWDVEKPWKLRMTGTRPAFWMRCASRSSAADIIASNPEGMVSRAKIASWTVLLRWPR